MHRYSKFSFYFLFSFLILIPTISFSQLDQTGVDSLEYLVVQNSSTDDSELRVEDPKKIYVLVEGLPPDAKKIGLDSDSIRAEAELFLRKANISPTKKENRPKWYIYININVCGGAFSVSLEFRRHVYFFVKGKPCWGIANVWDTSTCGTHRNSKKFITESMLGNLKIFVAEFLKANGI